MKPPPFSYHDPATLDQAVELLAALDNARPLAGGQSLMPMLNMRFVMPDHIVDLNRIAELAGIAVDGEMLVVGAMTRQRDVEFSALVAERCPILVEALRNVGHRQTRNRGTIGGSLCHLDPAAELPTVACALDAQVEVVGPQGRRVIPFAEFPLGYMTPAIEPNELATRIAFPMWDKSAGSAFLELSRRHGDFAIVSAAALLSLDADGAVARAALALGGVGEVPLRMSEAEAALVGRKPTNETLREASEICRQVEAVGDVYTPAAYRRRLAGVMARRALEQALARCATAN